jgi:hypothetical protein
MVARLNLLILAILILLCFREQRRGRDRVRDIVEIALERELDTIRQGTAIIIQPFFLISLVSQLLGGHLIYFLNFYHLVIRFHPSFLDAISLFKQLEKYSWSKIILMDLTLFIKIRN